MISTLPTPIQYQEVIQNPKVCFGEAELQNCQVETDPVMGLPRVRSGGFAITYKLQKPGKEFAVRCFHKPIADREQRHEAVSQFLQQCISSDIFISTHYVKSGILVKGQWYPITFMPWVTGDTLGTFLDHNYKNQQVVASLAEEFERVVGELVKLNIAHGDLSGANIIIKNNKMILIDYDGMFVPGLKGYQSHELGNVNFQHPGRTNRHFDTSIDRFSCLVIYLSLAAISKKPSLWANYGNGEGLLFGRKDFDSPLHSAILAEVEQFPDLKPFVNQFRQVCQADFNNIPSLMDFLSKRPLAPSVPTQQIVPTRRYTPQFPVLNAKLKDTIQQREGEMVEVVGKITDTHRDRVKNGRYSGKPYLFFNFGNWQEHCFRLVAWPEVLDLFAALNIIPDSSFEGKFISVTGIISSYRGTLRIVLDSPKQIEILSGEREANERIKAYQEGGIASVSSSSSNELLTYIQQEDYVPPIVPKSPIRTHSLATPQNDVSKKQIDNDNLMDKLYANWPVSKPVQNVVSPPTSMPSAVTKQPVNLTPSPSIPRALPVNSSKTAVPANGTVKKNRKPQKNKLSPFMKAILLIILIIGIIVAGFLIFDMISRFYIPSSTGVSHIIAFIQAISRQK